MKIKRDEEKKEKQPNKKKMMPSILFNGKVSIGIFIRWTYWNRKSRE